MRSTLPTTTVAPTPIAGNGAATHNAQVTAVRAGPRDVLDVVLDRLGPELAGHGPEEHRAAYEAERQRLRVGMGDIAGLGEDPGLLAVLGNPGYTTEIRGHADGSVSSQPGPASEAPRRTDAPPGFGLSPLFEAAERELCAMLEERMRTVLRARLLSLQMDVLLRMADELARHRRAS